MDMYTQTSLCGCSRKNSAISMVSSRHPRHHHHHRPSLRPTMAVDRADIAAEKGDSGSISLASLHIRALKAPGDPSSTDGDNLNLVEERLTTDEHAPDDRVPVLQNLQNGSEYTTDTRAISKTSVDGGLDSSSHHSGLKVYGEKTVRGQGRNKSDKSCTVSRNGWISPRQASDVMNIKSRPLTQNDVRNFPRSVSMTRDVSDLVTHGHFVSRRPPPGGSKSKTETQQQQRMGRPRERCSSGLVTSSAITKQGRQTPTSALRARRGKSAGEATYCGRPCHACTLQQFQKWAKGKQLDDHDRAETPQKLFVMGESSGQHSRRQQGSGQAEEAHVTTVRVPGKGLPKLTGLKHELADPDFYERNRQDFQNQEQIRHVPNYPKSSRQDSRQALHGSRSASVIRNPDMLRHVQLGNQLLYHHQHDLGLLHEDCGDLLETILLYEIPGVSKMKNDYTGLVERPSAESAHNARHVPDHITTIANNATIHDTLHTPSFLSQPPPTLFLPSLGAGHPS